MAKTYDVCIVGPGAAGSTLSAHLACRAVDIIVAEGGPKLDTRSAFNTHAMPFEFPNRRVPTMRLGVAAFFSERSRGVGGESMLWNAVVWRFGPRDLKGRSIDSAGEDWPIRYEDLAPSRTIEREVGVCANADHLEAVSQILDPGALTDVHAVKVSFAVLGSSKHQKEILRL